APYSSGPSLIFLWLLFRWVGDPANSLYGEALVRVPSRASPEADGVREAGFISDHDGLRALFPMIGTRTSAMVILSALPPGQRECHLYNGGAISAGSRGTSAEGD